MGFFNRLFGSLRKNALDRDIQDEQRYHLDLIAQELESQGIEAQEARRLAALRFGSSVDAREETRRQDLFPWLDDIARDLRIAWRGLRHSPSYSVVVLLALALGIGANTAIYSVVHAALFRPLPYPDPDRVAFIFTRLANGGRTWANHEDIQDWARDSKTFSSIAAWIPQTVNLTGSGEPDRLRGGFVSENFFTTLGVPPAAGRAFLPAEAVPQGPRVAIATWGLWQVKFGGKPDFLNSKILLNGEPYTVIGILPQNFKFPLDQIDVWMPHSTYPSYQPSRQGINAAAIGRLLPGVPLATAEQELTATIQAMAQQFPDTNRERTGAQVIEFREVLAEGMRPQLLLLGGAVLLAFLVACANIATLTVSRVLSRGRELEIRATLGAGRARLVGHLFSEQFLLSFCGGALGLLLAYWFTRWIAGLALLPQTMAPRVEWPVAFAAMALAMLAAVLTGPLPAISLLRGKTLSLSAGVRSSSETRSTNRTRRLLVTASVAISVILLAGAGFLVRGFQTLTGIDPGFDPQNLFTLEYRMPQNKYPKPEQQAEFHRRVAEEASSLGGVVSASVMMALPFSGNGSFGPYEVVGQVPAPKGSEPRAQVNRVDPRYFKTLRIPLLQGRGFEAMDRLGSRRVAIVSRSMAERCWPGEDALNRQLIFLDAADPEPFTVVGVVGDSKHNNLEEESRDKAYVPFAQTPHIFGTLAVRTAGDPASYANAIRQAVWNVDPDQPVWKLRTMESLIDGSVANRRVITQLLSGFSAFALLLAAIGLYGVISYAVARRTKELGIRAAMGATRGVLVGSVLAEGMKNIAFGLVLGLAGAIPALGLLRQHVFQIRATDFEPYAAAILALVAAALLATAIPARRVASINVSDILRQD